MEEYECPSCGSTKKFPKDQKLPLCPVCCYNTDRDGPLEIMLIKDNKDDPFLREP